MSDISKHDSMRGWFAYELYQQMVTDPDIYLITADLGYGMLDNIKRDFPDRFINTGAAEQSALGIAVGLALEGKKPFVYSITPFLLWRGAETIRNYINHEKIAVRLIGGGRSRDYVHDGYSHFAGDDNQLMHIFDSIAARWPRFKEEIPHWVDKMVKENKPWYINLTR